MSSCRWYEMSSARVRSGCSREMMERLEKGEDVDVIDAEIVSETTVAGSTATEQQSASQSEPQPDRTPEPAGS